MRRTTRREKVKNREQRRFASRKALERFLKESSDASLQKLGDEVSRKTLEENLTRGLTEKRF